MRSCRPALRAGLPLACMVLLSACSFWGREDSCALAGEYQQAAAVADVSVPAGLDAPDATGHLNVPPAPVPAEPLARTAGCLQRPPGYFDKPVKEPAK